MYANSDILYMKYIIHACIYTRPRECERGVLLFVIYYMKYNLLFFFSNLERLKERPFSLLYFFLNVKKCKVVYFSKRKEWNNIGKHFELFVEEYR